ncbi:MAG: winged helix-turn-helix transcriptional regulator [Candidatus Methanomethylophilaceae archaeon]|nr:winged helix-turn-helix transcriptional regulator [Candidatus Methanomethylophilaceae archaeon]MBR4698165.1 winged helix-turn-helix transcriptional regulator [Candidatus Methanomethylophilaceae archaeon]MBR6870537.1 winged helix-turn-helix transcriptional regulator [Candidatus Methanomethylophilaceae archaeon]
MRNSAAEDVENQGFRHYHIPFLISIARYPGTSQKGLCERVPLDKSRVSIVVRELISLGLAVNSSTGKVWALNLTPKGMDAYKTAMEITIRMDDSMFSVLTEEEIKTFLDITSKISQRIDELSGGDVFKDA